MDALYIHVFEKYGKKYFFDARTCYCSEVSEIAYHILQRYDLRDTENIVEDLADIFDERQVREVLSEIETLKEHGLFSHLPEKLLGITKEQATNLHPKVMVLMIAQACNLRCRYCYGGGGTYGTEGLMTRDTAKRAIDFGSPSIFVKQQQMLSC